MRIIDLERWPRRALYDFFSRYDYPFFNVCTQVDVTALRRMALDHGLSFFRCALYVLTDAANAVPELRTRVRGEQVVEHERVHPRFTARSDDGLFRFCAVPFSPEPAVFFERLARAQLAAAAAPELADEPERDDLLFVSVVPWIAFSGVVHPINLRSVDSIPRLVLGKAQERAGRAQLPVAVQVHHGLADGAHVAQLLEGVEARSRASGEIFQQLLSSAAR